MKTQVFNFILILKSPKAETTVNLNFNELEDEIKRAIAHANYKHGGYKTLELLSTTQKSIQLKLTIKTEKGILTPSREVSTFSRYLYNECNWSKYSSIPNRLFTVSEFEEETLNTDDSEILIQNKVITPTDIRGAESYMTDNEMINLIKFIIKNQNVGSNETKERRKKTINQIKSYLVDMM